MTDSNGNFGGGTMIMIMGPTFGNVVDGLVSISSWAAPTQLGQQLIQLLAKGVIGIGDIGIWGQGGTDVTLTGGQFAGNYNFTGRVGVLGDGPLIGVAGRVAGQGPFTTNFPSGVGVLGSCFGQRQNSNDGTVRGSGVTGESDGNLGVFGSSNTSIGVGGFATGTLPGVAGRADRSQGVLGLGDTGVHGEGQTTGVSGFSDKGIAVDGRSNSGFCAVYADCRDTVGAYCNSENGTGLYARGGSLAGYFVGEVDIVGGPLRVFGPKSSVVPHPDGSHRMLYCLESTDSWFEDFGEATLVGGKAKVRIDRDFAAFVKTDRYHVFLTPYGNSKGLYVANRTKTGFEVREQLNGKSRIRFSYKIVAKRKDIKTQRLSKVKLLKLPKPPKTSKLSHKAVRLEPPKRTVNLPSQHKLELTLPPKLLQQQPTTG
jgi:hypothetical protein